MYSIAIKWADNYLYLSDKTEDSTDKCLECADRIPYRKDNGRSCSDKAFGRTDKALFRADKYMERADKYLWWLDKGRDCILARCIARTEKKVGQKECSMF